MVTRSHAALPKKHIDFSLEFEFFARGPRCPNAARALCEERRHDDDHRCTRGDSGC